MQKTSFLVTIISIYYIFLLDDLSQREILAPTSVVRILASLFFWQNFVGHLQQGSAMGYFCGNLFTNAISLLIAFFFNKWDEDNFYSLLRHCFFVSDFAKQLSESSSKSGPQH